MSLAAGGAARSVVSIGSGGGLVGLWLLRGMRPDGVLTALDGDPEQLRAARKAFADSGIAPSRTRLILPGLDESGRQKWLRLSNASWNTS